MFIGSFQLLRIIFYRMLSNANVVGNPILKQPLLAVGYGSVHFIGRVTLGFFPSPGYISTNAFIEARGRNAVISISEGTQINNGFTAVAEHTSISIGKRVLIGTNVEIIDSDFHGVKIDDRGKSLPEWAAPVVIEDDVFIGSNVRILKGVTIGHGAVVANSSVVTRDIPSGAIAGGNPARVLRQLSPT